jgi:predicted Fe-S protein YdhL (DUF1289 family)
MSSASDRHDATSAASPCISVCTLDATGRICVGCYRTIDEIAVWGTLDDDEKRAVNAALPARRLAMGAAHGER